VEAGVGVDREAGAYRGTDVLTCFADRDFPDVRVEAYF